MFENADTGALAGFGVPNAVAEGHISCRLNN